MLLDGEGCFLPKREMRNPARVGEETNHVVFPSRHFDEHQVLLLARQKGDLVLVEMPAGEYNMVCLFPDSSGVPHLAFGQETTFTVQ